MSPVASYAVIWCTSREFNPTARTPYMLLCAIVLQTTVRNDVHILPATGFEPALSSASH